MSKKLLATMAIVAGLFLASSAMALEMPELAALITDQLVAAGENSGNTAGTILNPEGKGDVLIFPYYDVREVFGKTQDFYFAIINSEPDRCEGMTTNCNAGIAAKLRFREWDKSVEVFDIDIWLSRGDVWVGVLTHNLAIPLPYGTRITSPDWVILAPSQAGCAPLSTFTIGTPLAGGFDFPNTATIPTGSSNLYGYFEVIGTEMTFDKQAGNSVTRICVDAENTMMGYAYLVRVQDGSSFAYNAKAIANFSRHQGSLYGGAGGTQPTLLRAEDSLDQIEFILSKNEIYAGYTVEDIFAGKFSLILTFPTKHFHFCGGPNFTSKNPAVPAPPCGATYPFGWPWNVEYMNKPETIDVEIWDRNENKLVPQNIFYSPQTTVTVGLPFEVSIIGLYKGTPPVVPALNIRDNVAFSTGTFDSGYVVIDFPNFDVPKPGNKSIALGGPLTAYQFFGNFFSLYEGLPVLGLSLQEFFNTTIAGGAYGDIRDVFYAVEWTPSPGGP